MWVYIVDDDHAIHASIRLTLERHGIASQSFLSGAAFLDAASELPIGCALLDVRMPDMDGLALQARMQAAGLPHPVVLLTGYGHVPDAVQAMRDGAIDFLQKPFRQAALLAALDRAFALAKHRLEESGRLRILDLLTKREREVVNGLARGHQSKIIAYELGISIRTVEMHRANIMEKLGAKSIGPILLMAQDAGMLHAA